MPDHEFDDLINRMLDGMEMPPDPGDWSLMADALQHAPLSTDSDLRIDHPIDAFVRDQVGTLSPELQAADWEAFAACLDDNPLDTAVRNSLDVLELVGAQTDWPLMEQALDQPFYSHIQRQLATYEPPVSGSDWPLMQTMLLRQGIQRRAFGWMTWTTMSMAAVLTALVAVFLLKPETKIRAPHPAPFIAQQSAPTPAPSEGQRMAATQELPTTTFGSQAEGLSGPDLISPALAASETDIDLDRQQPPTESWQVVHQNQVHFVSYRPLGQMLLAAQASTASPEPVSMRASNRPTVRLGFLLGPLGATSELTDVAQPGYAAGIRAEVQLNERVSILAGAFFSEKRFRNRVYLYGNTTQTSLRDGASAVDIEADFQTLETPLLLRLNLPSEEKAKIYAQAGVTTIVALRENYRRTVLRSEASSVQARQPMVSQRGFNTYAANLYGALGVEYEVKSGISIQIEPYFQLGLQRTAGTGIGAQKKLYAGGVLTGLAVKL